MGIHMINKLFATLLLLVSSVSVTSWASSPPPPVNQNLGMPDAISNNMTANDCGGCHFNPDTAPAPVKLGYLPDRHHLRVDTPIEAYSASPFPEKSTDGNHKCITCHLVDWVEDPSRPLGGYFKFALEPTEPEFRDCLSCHKQVPGITSVHHLTKKAQAAECNACHGSLINDPNGELWELRVIPSMSPNPGFGDGGFGATGNRTGGCRYCHNGGTDDVTGRVVPGPNANMLTHHGTGLGQPGSGTVHTCNLCHDATPPNHTLQGCVRCHAPTSLHTIQADSDGNGTVWSYGEQRFFGHIGSSWDCMGCHEGGSNIARSTMVTEATDERPLFGPILPEIEQINTAKILEGTSPILLFSGTGYLEATAGKGISTRIVLTPINSENPTIEVTPTNLSFTSMEVQIPSTLLPGNYNVSAANGTSASAPLNLVVTPVVNINSVSCNSGTVTIDGSGFSRYLDVVGSGTGVVDIGTSQQCDVQSWTDSRIIADCASSAVDNIRINSVFGDASANTDCETGRPDWWSLWSWFASWGWSGR